MTSTPRDAGLGAFVDGVLGGEGSAACCLVRTCLAFDGAGCGDVVSSDSSAHMSDNSLVVPRMKILSAKGPVKSGLSNEVSWKSLA